MSSPFGDCRYERECETKCDWGLEAFLEDMFAYPMSITYKRFVGRVSGFPTLNINTRVPVEVIFTLYINSQIGLVRSIDSSHQLIAPGSSPFKVLSVLLLLQNVFTI
jgi:hypothetical protein